MMHTFLPGTGGEHLILDALSNLFHIQSVSTAYFAVLWENENVLNLQSSKTAEEKSNRDLTQVAW